MNSPLDILRARRGLLTPEALLTLVSSGVDILDPYSTLISDAVQIEPGCLVYPGVVLECDGDSALIIGPGCVLYPGTRIVAASGGRVELRDGVEFGDGGARAYADRPGTQIHIGSRARINNGAQVLGTSRIGDGAQILGAISAQSVQLADGADYTHPDPDKRGGVLKGFGTARTVTVGAGEVINGKGDFADHPVERQRTYHPDAPRT